MAKVTVPAGLIRFITNQTSTLTQYALSGRRGGRMGMDGPRRDIDVECQYPKEVVIDDYVRMWKREGYGKKVVETLPNECFLVEPDVYENEKKRFTPFEKAWVAHASDPDVAPLSALHHLDVRCGVGRFGVMVIGLDDAAPLDTPALAENADGTLASPSDRRVMWLRSYDESRVTVLEIEGEPSHPRYLKPTFYEVLEDDSRTYSPGTGYGTPYTGVKRRVHWTRVIHAADGAAPGESLGSPRQEAVWNRLEDLRKILGGDGEMFWKAGFSGIALTADPTLLEAGTVEIDEEALREQLRLYMDGLQRYLTLVGMSASKLDTTVADPTPHVIVHLNAIACAQDIPLRIFLGSEEAKLASGHDMRSWGRRVARRQNKFVSPWLVRPYIDRLIDLRALPAPKVRDPKTKRHQYKIDWPTIDTPTDDEKSTVTDRLADAMMKYIQGGCHELMQPTDFLRYIMKLEPAVVEEVMANIAKAAEIEFTPLNPPPAPGGPPGTPPPGGKGGTRKGRKKGGDTGVAGDRPPSDPRPATVK